MGKFLRLMLSAIVIVWILASTPIFTILILISRPFSARGPVGLARLWFSILSLMSGSKVEIRGREGLDREKSYMFASNHVSAADIAFLYYCIPMRIGYLAKKELFYIPFFGWSMWALGHIAVDRKSPQKSKQTIDRAAGILRKGKTSLVVFPEGTRSPTGELGPFKLGVFSLAIEAGLHVVPVAIQGTGKLLPKGTFLVNPTAIKVSFGAAIPTDSYTRQTKSDLSDKVRAQINAILDERTELPS